MEKVLLVLLFISNVLLSFQLPTKVSPLPAPTMKYNTPIDSWAKTYKLSYTWNPVESPADNPVLGYKVKVWIPKKTKTTFVGEQVGDTVFVRKVKVIDYNNLEKLDYDPIIIKDVAPNITTVMIEGLEVDETYLYRVQAYSAAGDGPLSSPFTLKKGPSIRV